MVITIVGWYGTETIGDRAILAGIIDIFDSIDSNNKIYLASLYPFYSERAVLEDITFFQEISNNVEIEVFDVRDKKTAISKIKESQMVLMGGGPLTDIYELDYIESCFRVAKRNKIVTGLIGVGVGPIDGKSFFQKIGKIVSLSDIIITREKESMDYVAKNYKYKGILKHSKDPAILPLFAHIGVREEYQDKIVINFRKYPFAEDDEKKINKYLVDYIADLLMKTDKEIILLSNHYFHIGGDDREFYMEIQDILQNNRIHLQSAPISLKNVLEIIKSATICVGMRYHAILFQTYLNGNNYILDYTRPGTGKTSNFLREIDVNGFYQKRYINLHELEEDCIMTHNFSNESFVHDPSDYENTKRLYVDNIKEVLDNKATIGRG